MTRRFFSRVEVNPARPEARGICDRCGIQYNLRDLRWQFQYVGGLYQNKRILVCGQCYDYPSEFLKVVVPPADPPVVYNARPEFYAIDEYNFWSLTGPPPGPIVMRDLASLQVMLQRFVAPFAEFAAASGLAGALHYIAQPAPLLNGVAGLDAIATKAFNIAPALDGISGLSSTVTKAFNIVSALDGAAGLSGTVTKAFNIAAALDGAAGLSAIATLAFNQAPTLNGVAVLNGTMTLAFNQAPTLNGVAGLTAINTTAFQFSPTVAATAGLSATIYQEHMYSNFGAFAIGGYHG